MATLQGLGGVDLKTNGTQSMFIHTLFIVLNQIASGIFVNEAEMEGDLETPKPEVVKVESIESWDSLLQQSKRRVHINQPPFLG